MITRSWHGAVRAADAERYHRYLLDTGLADYRRTPGNLGVHALRRIEGDVAHFELITRWRDLEAVRAFAGDDLERARYYPQDEEFLLELEPAVRHHRIIADPGDSATAGAGVARIWRGWAGGDAANAYQRLLLGDIFPGIAAREMPGYRGIHLLRRADGALDEFVTVMWFDSREAAARFSHDPGDPERAVVPPAARALLGHYDPRSRHFEVLATE